jgi:hypothetical protein
MALQGDYTFNGIPVAGAIAVVEYIWFRRPYEMTFQVPIYANQAQREAANPLASTTYAIPYVPAEGDVYQQCYDYLLTLPEYAGWTVTP